MDEDDNPGDVGPAVAAGSVDARLEVLTLPVSDVQRARSFYGGLGWREDRTPPGRFQFTPPGSSCSIQFGTDLVPGPPGSAQRMFLVTPDIVAAREQLRAAGVDVGEIVHMTADGPRPGLAPNRESYRSLSAFQDPDGNGWQLQEVTRRLPGRVAGPTSFASRDDLAQALRRAAVADGGNEERVGEDGGNWADRYAQFLVDEQTGIDPPA